VVAIDGVASATVPNKLSTSVEGGGGGGGGAVVVVVVVVVVVAAAIWAPAMGVRSSAGPVLTS
jgi:hypothetical protein